MLTRTTPPALPKPQVVILTDSRWQQVQERAQRLFPEAILCAPEAQPVYRMAADDDQLLFHPRLPTTAAIVRWVLNVLRDDAIFLVTDDYIDSLWWMFGDKQRKYNDPAMVKDLVEHTCRSASILGCGVFGFNPQWDIRRVETVDRIGLAGPIGGPIGIIGREMVVDTAYRRIGWEIDLALQSLALHRKLHIDTAWHFHAPAPVKSDPKPAMKPGGPEWEADLKRLKQRWGGAVAIQNVKGVNWPQINVRR